MVSTLVFGVFFAPFLAHAFDLSSFFGDKAHASAITPELGQINDNSQTMALLQANVSSASLNNDEDISASDTDNIVSDNALAPATSPLGVSDGTDVAEDPTDQISVYKVHSGDTLSLIAQMFNVSVNTILSANDMKKGDVITEGQVLVILPISGIEHTIAKGETLAGIAKIYKVDAADIASYNGISPDEALAVGDELIIPNAEDSESDQPVQNLSASIAKDNQYYATHPIKNISGYYVNPVPGAIKSQGIHDHNAVDLAVAKGTPIYAAASGVVLVAKTGCVQGAKNCGGGFGNYVIINHPNGTQTLYAHQSKVVTYTGAQVKQGQVIGYVGSTGHSTGAHLHFEVHGARNPGANGSWKY